jgi:hypothetical protein
MLEIFLLAEPLRLAFGGLLLSGLAAAAYHVNALCRQDL